MAEQLAWRVREGFSFDDENGRPITPKVGTLLPSGHPWVAGHEHFLEPVDEAAARTAAASSVSALETADAPPGAARQVTTGRRRPSNSQ